MTPSAAVSAPLTPRDAGRRLLVAERFGVEQPTFQGEGPSCGHPAVFIRLSRCNLTCARCDTKYTWDWDRFDSRTEATKQTVADLLAWVVSSPIELVVITGGEPLLQQRALVPLVDGLLNAGKRIELETNGTLMPNPALLTDGVRFNVSPKIVSFGVSEDKSLIPPALEAFVASGRATFKFVASSLEDLERIAELAAAHSLAPVWVMPEGTTAEAITSTTRLLAGAVADRHWHFTARLHILAFADARGR